MIYDWQGDNGATDLHINDRWDQIFDAASIPEGNMSDRLYAWLGNLGHTQDNVNARWQSYWENTEAPSEDIMFWNDDDEVLWNDDDEVLW